MRFSVNADLTDADLDRIVRVCRDIRDEVDMATWPSTRRTQRHKERSQSEASLLASPDQQLAVA
jgi:CAI-1 autoinducer synthase